MTNEPMTPPTSPLTEGPYTIQIRAASDSYAQIIPPVITGNRAVIQWPVDDAQNFVNRCNSLVAQGFAEGVAHATDTQSARVKELEAGLKEIARFIVAGNSAITDTIWHGDAETLVDYIGNVLGYDVSDPTEPGPTDLTKPT